MMYIYSHNYKNLLMKKIAGLLCVIALVFGCNTNQKKEEKIVESKTEDLAYVSIGKEIIADDALPAERMAEHLKD